MDLPRISIVTPSYMQGHFLEWTIRSVLGQEYPNLEYIVMDGGSTDATRSVIERYSRLLSHWESKKDNGQADAIARGFEKTTGEIMAYLNSDDMLTPGTLHKVAKYFAENPTSTSSTVTAALSTRRIASSATGSFLPTQAT